MHVRLLLKQQCAPPAACSQSNQFTSPASTGKHARIRPGPGQITCIPLFVPITMATLCKQRPGRSSPSQTIFPAAGSHMNSAVHVPPSPSSACAPPHRKADCSPNPAATEPLPRAGGQLAAWHTLHHSHQLQHVPARAPASARSSVGKLRLASQGVPKISHRAGRADPTLGGDSNTESALAKSQVGAQSRKGSSRCCGTSREATGPEAWQGNGCAPLAQQGRVSPRSQAKRRLGQPVLPESCLDDAAARLPSWPGLASWLGAL